MRILAFLTDAPIVEAILLSTSSGPTGPRPFTPARAPLQSELSPDQSSEFDLTASEPVLDFDFDQSLPDACD
jgi:hypothetical protein